MFHNQQYAAAETEYLQLLSIDSQYTQADIVRYRLGWCAYYLGKYELAVMQFSQLITSFPKSPLVKSARESRQFIYEIADFVPTIDSDPAIIPFNLARKFQNEENDADAISFYERVVQNYPKSPYASYAAYHIARLHLANYKKLTTAYRNKKTEYQQVLHSKVNPQVIVQRFAEFALQEELMYQQLLQTEQAYARVTAQFPDSFQRQLAHLDLIELYLEIGDKIKATAECETLIELTNEFPNSLLGYHARTKLKLLK
ncbi:MAG: tetratricopeptide repeat protein [bacterium]|nr:tetratricopeptide repeat protein [bacterium]